MVIEKGAVVGGEEVTGSVPGFDYLQRVALAWGNALTAVGERINQNWTDIRSCQFGVKEIVSSWGDLYQIWATAALETLKGPNFKPRPNWVLFEYDSTTNLPNALTGEARLDQSYNPEVFLADSEYAGLNGTAGPFGKLSTSRWAMASRFDRIRIDLNRTLVAKLSPGFYLGFVTLQGTTGLAPLAIVLLRVFKSPEKK